MFRRLLDSIEPHFKKDGKLKVAYPLYEALDTFLYTPGEVTHGASHVRDALDLKRMMTTVVVALLPCIFMAMWNTGYQANLAIQDLQPIGSVVTDGVVTGFEAIEATETSAGRSLPWRYELLQKMGFGFDPSNILACLLHGALYFVPVYLVTNMAGGFWEVLFATIRKHEINEGFLVTGFLFPLTLPPTIPLWQVAIGISFGVVIGKEVFGGTGRNFLNPALTARAFLYFAYPTAIVGDAVWTACDGFSAATPLGALATAPVELGMTAVTNTISLGQAFFGTMQGSMGETSTLACILGAMILIGTGIGSWRIMAGVVAGAIGFSMFLTSTGSETNPMFAMPFYWHLCIGGFAFGTVFMATDPVSAAMTDGGKWLYGLLIGVLTILIRVINPAYPEGIMLAILFGNVFAPLIDWFFVQANIKRRAARNA
jgi:Na+-transporting NADH:ubiquinone oxidoreductase subunit B